MMQLASGTVAKRSVRPRVPTITAKYSQRCPNGTYRRLDAKSELNKRVLDPIPVRYKSPRRSRRRRQLPRTKHDRYTKLMSLLKLSSLASYTASKLIEGVSIKIDDQKTKAEVQYLTVVPFFDVKETFVLDGMTRTKNKRRDLESGPSTCTATLVNDSADVESENYVLKLKMSWDEPNKGGMLEEMHVSTAGELVVTSTVQVREGSATCRTVYEKVESGQLVTNFQWNALDAVRVMTSGRLPTDRR